MRPMFWVVPFAGFVLVDGCFSQFRIEPCNDNRDCQGVNVDHGIPADAPQRWQCDRNANRSPTGFCRLSARDDDGDGDLHASDCDDNDPLRVGNGSRVEEHDGIDNDCDGVIDDGVWVAQGRNPDVALESAQRVSSVARSDGRPSILLSDGGTLARLLPSASSMPVPLTYRRWWLDRNQFTSPMSVEGCPVAGDRVIGMGSGCQFVDHAFAPLDPPNGWLLATVDASGCEAGWLRVGRFSTPSGEFMQSDTFSNLGAGVGVRTTADCRGAAHPAIATVEEGPTQPFQALVVWLAGQGTSRSVRALGVWGGPDRDERIAVCGAGGGMGCVSPHEQNPPRDATGNPIRSDGAESIELGDTTSIGRPAVVNLSGAMRGFLVAYGDSSSVQMRVVSHIEVPSLRVGVVSPPRILMSGALNTGSTGTVEDVAAATIEGTTQVGIVWRQNARVRFARIDLGSMATPRVEDLSSDGSTRPTIAYASGGFVDVGVYRRHGHTPLPGFESSAGGWVVSWVEGSGTQSRVLGRRVRAFDGARDDGEAVLIETGVGTVSYHAVHPVSGGGTFLTTLIHSLGAPLVSRDLVRRPPPR